MDRFRLKQMYITTGIILGKVVENTPGKYLYIVTKLGVRITSNPMEPVEGFHLADEGETLDRFIVKNKKSPAILQGFFILDSYISF